MRILIETLDIVREVNRWEVADAQELIPDWDRLTKQKRIDRLAELIGDGAEFCKNLEAETIERGILTFAAQTVEQA